MPVVTAATGLLRLGQFVVGAGACLYATLVFAVWTPTAEIERAASRILMGDRYKTEDVERHIAAVAAGTLVRASSQRAVAILALRRAETSIDEGRRTDIDADFAALARLAPAALLRAPSDSFLWLALFWRNNVVEGFAPDRLRLLAMSYATGPSEGWVGAKRSAVALAAYERLTPELQERVASEFAGLVRSRFPEAPGILLGPGWAVRGALLPRLAAVEEPERKAFARALYRAGVDVDVPGIDPPDSRPWSR